MQKFIGFLLLFLLTLLHTPSVYATTDDYYATDYKVLYGVSEDGVTNVKSDITLTNLTEEFFTDETTMQFGFEDIDNITASDQFGRIVPVLEKTGDGTKIKLEFNRNVVGKGTSLRYSISFDTKDIANKQGKIWEINIPKLANQNSFRTFTAEVKVPDSFGEPAYIKPNQGSKSLIFTKEQLEKSGISVSFGTDQIYGFRLFYHLRNQNLFPVRTEIALPPDTNYQTVALEKMTPRPLNVTKDKDGNWLGEYRLLPSQALTVIVEGKAQINLLPKPESLTDEMRDIYLQEKPHWEVNDPKVKEVAQNLKTPQAIYDYVVKTLSYDYSRVTDNQQRAGAKGALINPQSAVCLEFTDLFITLARAAGIPARQVEGFAYTDNERQRPLSLLDILHSWPEYYDDEKKTWIMVDPTWGHSTGGVDYFHTLDFDHFAFIRKGSDSQYPIPPSGYKYSGADNTKDVHVTFAKNFPEGYSLSVASLFGEEYLAGVPLFGAIRVTNNGPRTVQNEPITLSSSTLTPDPVIVNTERIIPFGSVDVPISFTRTSLLTNGDVDFTMKVLGASVSENIFVTPFIFTVKLVGGGLIIGILTVGLFIIARKSRRLSLLRHKR